MLKINFKILFFTALLGSMSSAFAIKSITDCNKFDLKTFAYSHCLDEVKDAKERELQTWVNHHSFSLEEKAMESGRYSALNMFKRSQNNFITFRENNCRWKYLAATEEDNASSEYQKCYISMTKERIVALQDTE